MASILLKDLFSEFYNEIQKFDESYLDLNQVCNELFSTGVIDKLKNGYLEIFKDDAEDNILDALVKTKYENKAEFGIYPTADDLRQTIVQIVFFDVLKKKNCINDQSFKICDPACGNGGLLISAIDEIKKYITISNDEICNFIYGFDNFYQMALFANINMRLNGCLKPKIFYTNDSLASDMLKPETFDLIITNPPSFKGGINEKEHKETLSFFRSGISDGHLNDYISSLAMGSKPNDKGKWLPVISIDPAVLFIDRCLQLLKPGGRLAIIIPEGILCNSGYSYVRQYLSGKSIVKAIINLPPFSFDLYGTVSKMSLLYLVKKPSDEFSNFIFMAVAHQMKTGNKKKIESTELENIVEHYKIGYKNGK
ncbi:MAG: SAM-dependent DNA methyltransferase [Desulfobacterales bacterium]|nr:SAM-dependent DNA methyltransferase [Desulfobacterales bacterium]